MATNGELLLTYYGDDFTGSTDALECLTLAGVRTMLFIEPPTPKELAKYPGLQAVGVAGMTRSMPPEAMIEVLYPALSALRALGAPHVHYKVCSTFDSSPTIGSIGCVIDLAVKIFDAQFVPLLVGAPALGRHCVFGNLFARFGGEGEIFRLDRHPSMRQHPITPTDEGDLRLHLARQTKKKIGLFDILKVDLPLAEAEVALETLLNQGAEIVLFDVLYAAQLELIGALIDSYASHGRPLFSVGSSGIEMALGANWALKKVESWNDPGPANPLLVVSGSCSPVTENQIVWALEHGFAEVVLDVEVLEKGEVWEKVISSVANATVSLLVAGRSVVLHSGKAKTVSRQPNAPEEINRLKYFAISGGMLAAGTPDWKQAFEIEEMTTRLGMVLGTVVRFIVVLAKVRRVCVAGGDTSGHVARQLGIEALEMIAPLAPGAPLCRVHAPGLPADGLQVVFKGGQVGNQDFFGMVQRGKP